MTANQRKNLVVLGLTLIALAAATAISLNPDYYYFRNPEDREQWHHPTGSFLIFCCFFVVEALLLSWALKLERQRPLWKRTALAGVVLVPWAVFSSLFVIHAPGYMHFHLLWVWAILATLIGTAAVSGIAHVARKARSAA
jgi:hypothetical protein